MLEIDGSAGGGQLLRTALALSALTDTPFRMTDVRGDRPTPGLKAQHAACVRAAAAVADAEVEGGAVGDDAVTFEPNEVTGGDYAVAVDTAGSLTLVFETVLPLAVATETPLTLHATGGTDVAWSPPIDYLRRVKLPLLARHGLLARVDAERRGFYPAGSGAARLTLSPSSLNRIDLPEPVGRPDVASVRVFVAASTDLAASDAAERLAAAAAEGLADDGHRTDRRRVLGHPDDALLGHLDVEHADVRLQRVRAGVDGPVREQLRVAGDRGVTAQVHLLRRREVPDPAVGLGRVGEERRLARTEFRGDGSHPVVVELVGVGDHPGRVAGARLRRERVHQ